MIRWLRSEPPLFASPMPDRDLQLLTAALSDGAQREAAWRAWEAAVDFDLLTVGCLLVPAAYVAIAEIDPDSCTLNRMRGAHRKNWVQSRIQLAWVQQLLAELAEEGPPPMIADDAPLAFHYYPRPAMRALYELTLIADRTMAARYTTRLEARGLRRKGRSRWHAEGQGWVRIETRRGPPDGSVPASFAPAMMLDPTAQLIHSLEAERPQRPLRLLDLGILLKHHDTAIDWARVDAWATAHGRTAKVREMLDFFARVAGLVPAGHWV